MAEMPHMIRREGDEYWCPRCNKRWSTNEEAPGPCIEDKTRLMAGENVFYKRQAGSRPMVPATNPKHVEIERIWRETYNHSDNVCLAGSDTEWSFFVALLDAKFKD